MSHLSGGHVIPVRSQNCIRGRREFAARQRMSRAMQLVQPNCKLSEILGEKNGFLRKRQVLG